MMEVIVVDLMSTLRIVLTVYATHSTVMVHRNSYQMVTAMMKPTMQTATMMEVTVVERVPTQTIVQIVSVMQSLRLIPIVSKHLLFILDFSMSVTHFKYTSDIVPCCSFELSYYTLKSLCKVGFYMSTTAVALDDKVLLM